MPLQRGQRSNSPFTSEQETWIILEFGALRNCLAVRRKLRLHYVLSPRKVWPKIRNIASRRMYWFQQGGAAVHITNGVREWLNKTFHGPSVG